MNETHIGVCNDSKTYASMYKRYLKNKTSRCEPWVQRDSQILTNETKSFDANVIESCWARSVFIWLYLCHTYVTYVCRSSETLRHLRTHFANEWIDTHKHKYRNCRIHSVSLKLIPTDLRSWAMTPKLLVHREQCLCCYRTQCLHIGFLNSYVRCEHWWLIIHERNMKWRSKV